MCDARVDDAIDASRAGIVDAAYKSNRTEASRARRHPRVFASYLTLGATILMVSCIRSRIVPAMTFIGATQPRSSRSPMEELEEDRPGALRMRARTGQTGERVPQGSAGGALGIHIGKLGGDG